MNEISTLTKFVLDSYDHFHIVDRNGNPWFVVKEIAEMLGIKYYRQTLSSFPQNEKSYIICAVISNDGTSAKSQARKTQRLLVINDKGLFRLIQKSRKPEADKFKEQIIEILADIVKKGIKRASLPKIWPDRDKELSWGEWVNKKERFVNEAEASFIIKD